MTDITNSKYRDGILRTLEQADAEEAEIERNARDLLVTVRNQRDVNKALGEVIKTLPDDSPIPEERWRDLQSLHDRHIIQARALKSHLGKVPLYISSAYANLSTSATSTAAIVDVQSFANPNQGTHEWYDSRFVPRLKRLNEVVRMAIAQEELEHLFEVFQLDRNSGEIKSALVRLQEAYLALNQANAELATATSILIPLRDCIEAVSGMLLQRRPTQEKAAGLQKQIQSIGTQCKHDYVDADYFVRLGAQAACLHDIYSRAKDKRMLRDEVLVQFNAGIALIRTFLHAIDPNKLK